MNNSEESLTPKKKSADHDTSSQTDSPTGPSISTADDVEIQRHFNELRGELLDKRAVSIDRWLTVIAIVLTFFGIVVAVAGYIGFTRFQEIETEAKGYVKDAERLVEEMKKNYDISVGYLDSIKTVNAEDVANNPEKTKQIAADVDENPKASLMDKAIAQAVFLQQQGKRDEAIEKWRAVAHITEGIDNDQAARAWFSIGYLLVENKKWEDSISAYDRAISLKPDLVAAYNNRGNVKGALGHRTEAIADFDEAIRLKPDLAVAYYNRGHTKEELGRHEDAIADFDEAIRLKPDYANAYNNRGVAKAVLGQRTEAIADYDEAIRLKPDYANAYNNRGNVKAALGQHNDAIADYDEAIRLKPDFVEAYNNRGIAKAKLEQYIDAIADYDEAIRLQPNYANAYHNRGNAKVALDRIDEARQDFEKARDLAREAGDDSLADLAEQGLRKLDSQEDE